jgi:hypothetical protein
MFRFSIRDVLWLTVVVGLAVCASMEPTFAIAGRLDGGYDPKQRDVRMDKARQVAGTIS